MLVPGLIYADEKLIGHVLQDQALEQVANVAMLPGIQVASLAMPDVHWGYGFCIGGVCATDPAEGGVVSPSGVGYDINCGARLMRTNLTEEDVRPHLRRLVRRLFERIPCGPGQTGRHKFSRQRLKHLMQLGPRALIGYGIAVEQDIEHTEAGGCLEGAEPTYLSARALERGLEQCGTLGGGNHFLEVQVVDQVLLPEVATTLGLAPGRVCVMIHSGSRGLGYQVCDVPSA